MSITTRKTKKGYVDVLKDIIFVDLPKRTSDVYISIIFLQGFYNESDRSFGLTHLLEHILASNLQKDLKIREVHGSISNVDTRFDIKSSKRMMAKHLTNSLETIFRPNLDDEKSLSKEKARIRIELYEQYTNVQKWLATETLSVLIKQPKFLKRKRSDQIETVEKFSLKQVKIAHGDLTQYAPIIFIGGYKLTETDKQTLNRIAINYISEKRKNKIITRQITYAKGGHKTVLHPVVDPRYVHKSLIFPAFSLQDSDLPDRFALGFICRELWQKLIQPIGEIGVYKADYEYFVGHSHGFVRFFSYVPKESKEKYKKILFSELEKLVNDSELNKKVGKYISIRKKSSRHSWNQNLERMDWVIDDIVDFGFIKYPEEIEDDWKKVTVEKIRSVAKKVFDEFNMSTLTVSSKR